MGGGGSDSLYNIKMLFLELEFYSTLYKTSSLPDVPLGQAICDTSPTLVVGHNTPRTSSSEQPSFEPSSEFKDVVDVAIVAVDAVVVVVAVIVFGLRSRNQKF